MATLADIKDALNAAISPLQEKLDIQARDLGSLSGALKRMDISTQERLAELRSAAETLSTASIATSQAIDKLNERMLAIEASELFNASAVDALKDEHKTVPPYTAPIDPSLPPLPRIVTYKLQHLLGPAAAIEFEAATDISVLVTSKQGKLITKKLKADHGVNGYNPENAPVKCIAHLCAELARNTQGIDNSELLVRHPHAVLQVVLASSPALKSRLSPVLRHKIDSLAVFTSEMSKAVVTAADKELYSTPELLLNRTQGLLSLPAFASQYQGILPLLSAPPKDPQDAFKTLVNKRDRDSYSHVFDRTHTTFDALVTELLNAYNSRRAVSHDDKVGNQSLALNAIDSAPSRRPVTADKAVAKDANGKVRTSTGSARGRISKTDDSHSRRRDFNKPSNGARDSRSSQKVYQRGRSRRDSFDSRSSSRGTNRHESSSGSPSGSPPTRDDWPRHRCPVCETNDHEAKDCSDIAELYKDDHEHKCPMSRHGFHQLRNCRLLRSLGLKFRSPHQGNERAKSSRPRMKSHKTSDESATEDSD